MNEKVSRRDFLRLGTLGAAGLTGASVLAASQIEHQKSIQETNHSRLEHDHAGVIGQVDPARNGFKPMELLTEFDYGQVSTLPNGQTLREYTMIAFDKEIEVAPDVFFPAWTYNGRVPGPTIRCTEGDRVRVRFVNAGTHPHTIHFHGVHTAVMDGVPGIGPGMIAPGESTVYEFDAEPFGCHPYHCHAVPLKRHIHKGLYGAFIIDPKQGRPLAREFVMVMNGFDTNFDGENEIYAVNTVAFEFLQQPISIKLNELVRIYLINMTEFDPLNSFHLHGGFFWWYPTGTSLEPAEYTDTVMLTQGQRGILEFRYKFPGKYMFHAHQSEFAELGWTGFFEVTP